MLRQALTTNDSRTVNGALTNSTSSNKNLDLFFMINVMRNHTPASVINSFKAAFYEDALTAVKILFYSRDIRGGQGERKTFRTILRWLAIEYPDVVRKNLHLIPEYGRWDDLFVLEGTQLEAEMLQMFANQLKQDYYSVNSISLAGKWAASEHTNNRDRKRIATKLMNALRVTPRVYRKILSNLRRRIEIVESQMSANEWSAIDYQRVPSVAMKNYRKAFSRHDPDGFVAYLDSVEKGEKKINASALYPYDLVRPFLRGGVTGTDQRTLEAAWNALPNFMGDGENMILPIVDTSGSMMTGETPSPMEVAVSLGLYVSERNQGPFKDFFITFSGRPQLQEIVGRTLGQRVDSLHRADWGANTNLKAVFELILTKARQSRVSPDQMPRTILIMSDMEFDYAVTNGTDVSLFNYMRQAYAESGYTLPQIVFWRLNVLNKGNFPVKYNQQGTALVSGFHPSLLIPILSGELDPMSTLYRTINVPRYNAITV